MTTALVTGGSGFIGRGLCRRPIESGVAVTATSRTSHEDGDLHRVQPDLAIHEVASRLVTRARPDRFYHLAGHVSGLRDLDAVGPSIHHTLDTSVDVLVVAASIVGPELDPDFGALADRLLDPARVADVLGTETLLGWKPRTELDYRLRGTIDWYRSRLGRPQATGGV